MINQSVHSEIEEIKMLTALDFYWNMEAYDMDFSLWKVLVSRYGVAAAKELILFNDALAGILETKLNIKNNDQVNKNYRTGLSILAELEIHLNIITRELGQDNKLVVELTTLFDENKSALDIAYQAVTP